VSHPLKLKVTRKNLRKKRGEIISAPTQRLKKKGPQTNEGNIEKKRGQSSEDRQGMWSAVGFKKKYKGSTEYPKHLLPWIESPKKEAMDGHRRLVTNTENKPLEEFCVFHKKEGKTGCPQNIVKMEEKGG